LQRIINDMQIPYTKMQGTGNLILVVDQRSGKLPPPGSDKLRQMGKEKTGPGFDQIMWISEASDDVSVASYRVFNADGSEAEQCGNGVRCVARYLAGHGEEGREFSMQSPAGPVLARIFADDTIAVSMGAPKFDPAEIPFEADITANSYELTVDHDSFEICAVSMGNPHAVLQVPDVSRAPVADIGARIECHERFPDRTNVGFMHINDRRNIDLRVFERGVGETSACGTGACAAVVSGQRLELLDEEVHVHLPGGQVVVSWRGGEAPAWLKGDAELINKGMLNL
jgi:diaminopimelate epimerase